MIVSSHASYLHSLVGWLYRLLAWQIAVTRQTFGALSDDEYRGLYVPDGEVDMLSMGDQSLPDEFLLRRRELADERDGLAAQDDVLA